MANKVIGNYTAAITIDGATHFMLIQPGNASTAYKSISRNVLLGVTGQPADTTTAQGISNKVMDNTNSYTIKDQSLTLQDGGDITRQAQFQLSSITPGQTRIYTLPDATSTLANLTSAQTFTNKTLTAPVISGGSISNTTVAVNAITGFSVAGNGTVYGLSINSGVLQTANSVTSTALASGSVTPNKLATGATAATVTTSEATSSTSYADLATVTDTVTVTVGSNGLALVIISGHISNNTTANTGYISFAASGANTIAASDVRAFFESSLTGLSQGQGSWGYLATGLAAGSTTFKMKYRTSANSCSFENRIISVIPL